MLYELLDERAYDSPDSIALRRVDDAWSYGQLRAVSLQYAHWLRSLGVGRQDRVVICAPSAMHTVAALFAVARLGAIFVIAADAGPKPALTHVVRDSDPKIVIGSADVAALLRDEAIDVVDFPAAITAAHEEPFEDSPALSIDPVSLIYTSGSTALPKAIVSTHAQICFAARAIHSQLRYRTDDVVFCCLPLTFDYALYQVFLACLAGATLVLGGADDAGPALAATLRRVRATVLPAVPSLALALSQLINRSRCTAPPLRLITNTGAHLPAYLADHLRAAIPGLDVVKMFGLTECKRVSIMGPNEDIARPNAVGRPLPDTEVSVVDETGAPLPPGEVGQIVVRGPHVMCGYWRAPDQTAQRFRRGEFGESLLYSGDYGYLDADGYLHFSGRRDDIYKQRGFRVSAIEVEQAALQIRDVSYAAVLTPSGEDGAVLVVGGPVTPEEVLTNLKQYIEAHKVPDRCVVMDTVPLTPSGKIDKLLLGRLLRSPAVGIRIVP